MLKDSTRNLAEISNQNEYKEIRTFIDILSHEWVENLITFAVLRKIILKEGSTL